MDTTTITITYKEPNPNIIIPDRKKRKGSRASGTNARALGTNPRAMRALQSKATIKP